MFVVFGVFRLFFKAIFRRFFACNCCCKRQCCHKTFIEESDTLPNFITFILKSCVEIGFAATISIRLMSDDRFSAGWDAMSSILAYWFAFQKGLAMR